MTHQLDLSRNSLLLASTGEAVPGAVSGREENQRASLTLTILSFMEKEKKPV